MGHADVSVSSNSANPVVGPRGSNPPFGGPPSLSCADGKAVVVTIPMLLAALAVGSALLAFWAAVRFPERGPDGFATAILHVFVSFGVGWAAGNAFVMIVGFGKPAAFVAIFFVVLPALVYAFLAGAWFLRLAHGAMSHYRH